MTSLVIINRTLVHHPHCYINTGVAGWLAYYLLITLVFTFFLSPNAMAVHGIATTHKVKQITACFSALYKCTYMDIRQRALSCAKVDTE